MNNIIGIDIGGTHFRIGLVDIEGDAKNFRFQKLPTKQVLHSGDVLRDLAEFIKEYAIGQVYNAVSIGFPATLNKSRTKILQAPNLEFMENLPVVDYLSEALGVPVYAERDVTMTLCYDMRKYEIDSRGITCGIYFGTGIGNAIMIDGKFLAGRNGTAGELGHIPVDGSEIKCGCGNVGCMENLAGGKYLAYLHKNYYPDCEIAELFVKYGQEDLLLEFVDRIAMSVATEINILDPDNIILGGGVLNMDSFPKNLLHEKIIKHTRKPYPAENLNIIYAEDEPQKSVIGAAYYVHAIMQANNT